MQALKQFFSYSKTERIGIFLFLIIIVLTLLVPLFTYKKFTPAAINATLVDSIHSILATANNTDTYYQNNYSNPINTSYSLFKFNPNTLNKEGWIKLGIREKTANTILKYVSKGGKFKQPEDIRKIWGLSKQEADKLIPYIEIPSSSTVYSSATNAAYTNVSNTNQSVTILNVNTATPQQLKQIPGFDNKLAYTMVNFREKLGGFITLEQIKETNGLTDSLYMAIKPFIKFEPITIKQLNINTATEYELAAHPYISKTLAKAITIYRSEYGNYNTVADVRKIVFITDEVFKKIQPYLTVTD